ncbi:X-ray repair cross-complementing protein 6-like isoform X2 [Vespa velutina]|uniref:X-ray repair cross-complementing protein 6-like isoform X2 n=1 Tax=Vespa velutina TaxID=202808 RepID=UPI001FB4BA49|nr:X-ray repair cross-complementing protein 6-like isoform X2 [Vespa velutina]
MSTIGEKYDTQDDSEKQDDLEKEDDADKLANPEELYGVRDGIIFLIDTSPEMFNNNKEGKPFFVECIEKYIHILKQKLVWNRQDWMGLIFMGTETCDIKTKIENIALKKFSLININKLKEAEKIRDNWKDYKNMSSSVNYPLHDALWHASQSFISFRNVTMSTRRVILYTCHDVPPLTDEKEKSRIRDKAASYNYLGISLYVVGLGETWNVEHFFKDIEMLSKNINEEDYQRTSYRDLLQQVKRPSKRIAKLPWRIGNHVIINVDICNVCVKHQDVKKMTMNSENNAPLIAYTYHRKTYSENTENEEDDDEEVDKEILLSTDLRKMKEFGGEKIYFTVDEIKTFNNIFEVGIDMIGFKPFYCDPMYHLHAPYFVSCNKNCSEGEQLLFAALLHKCKARNLIIICRVTLRKHFGSYLYNMMPVTDKGGFYLYKIPYNENVKNFTEEMYQYTYNDEDKTVPINYEGVELFEQIIEKSSKIYEPENFPNPKLSYKLQSVETLALDLDVQDPPKDETLPNEDLLRERIGYLTEQVNDVFMLEEDFGPSRSKKPKKSNKNTN